MSETESIAIETSCRAGGIALGRDETLLRVIHFDASSRHATQLVGRLKAMLTDAALTPANIAEIYVSAGPGSFTGLRVGITVARTLAQALPHIRCVAVPTAQAVAENARSLEWRRLVVMLDVKDGCCHASLFQRQGNEIVPVSAELVDAKDFLAACPKPILLSGEGLGFIDATAPGVTQIDPALRLPTAEGVWRVGRRLADAGRFTPYPHLLPIYSRKPEALRLWEKRQKAT